MRDSSRGHAEPSADESPKIAEVYTQLGSLSDLQREADSMVKLRVVDRWRVELIDEAGKTAAINIYNGDRLQSPRTSYYRRPGVREKPKELVAQLMSIAVLRDGKDIF